MGEKESHYGYVFSTTLYGLVALIGVVSFISFLAQERYFFVVLSVIVVYVALDNFFCGLRAKRAGVNTNKHYIIPSFLKMKSN